MQEEFINHVYVELDCIIDTRLSLMYDVDKDMMKNLIEMDKYHTRNLDQFGYLSVKAFRKLYSLRNSNILDNPLGTEIVDMIAEYCLESIITAKSYGEFKPVKIYLNLHPYNLTEENIELMRMGLINSTKMSNVEVEILNQPYEEVKPLFIKENIGLAVMYDALTWINHHLQTKELLDYNVADTTIITPMLVHRNIVISKKDINTFFEDIEASVKLLANLVYVPTKLFCFSKKHIKKKKK